MDQRGRSLPYFLLLINVPVTFSCLASNPTETLILSTVTPTTPTTTITEWICPDDWTLHQNGRGDWVCYVRVSGPLGGCGEDFGCNGFVAGCDAARTACQSLGGELVSIFSAGDNSAVFDLSDPDGMAPITSNDPGIGDVATQMTCIGLRDDTGTAADADYLWPDGTTDAGYDNWDDGGFAGLAGNPPVCVTMETSVFNDATWRHRPCGFSMRNGVCEQAATLITMG